MRHNGRPVMFTADMLPNRVSLHPGEPPAVACPVCDRWRQLERGMLRPHNTTIGARCPGSGQRVRVNETPETWKYRYDLARREAAQVRGGLWSGERAA